MLRTLAAVLFILPTLAFGEPELHAIGVYEGNIRTNGQIHGGQVRVFVDRTDNPVLLSLGSYEPVRWFIETSSGTRIDTVILHGRDPSRSEIFLNNIPVSPRIIEDVGYAYKNEGSKFRSILDALFEETGIDTLASFNGLYRATSAPFVIDKIVLDRANRIDHLKDRVRPQAVPETLRPFLKMAEAIETPRLKFTYDGFILTENGETLVIPPTLDVPDISHPSGSAYDKDGGRLFGVTFGGEGFIYQYDIAAKQWSVLASMENADASGMMFDREGDRLIFGYGLTSSGLLVYNFESGQLVKSPVRTVSLSGFTDLYDVGNGPTADLIPVAISGDLLLVRAGGSRVYRRSSEKSRTYLVNIRTGEATLVAYNDAQ